MSEKIEYSMVPIKMADLASFIAAKKNMAVSDAICYLYNSEFVAKLYDEKSKWWYLDNETLYELMEQERRNNSVDFSAQKVLCKETPSVWSGGICPVQGEGSSCVFAESF